MPAVTASGATTATPSPEALKAATANAPAVDGLFVVDKTARQSASEGIASLVQKDGPSAIKSTGFTDAVIKALGDKKSPAKTTSSLSFTVIVAR